MPWSPPAANEVGKTNRVKDDRVISRVDETDSGERFQQRRMRLNPADLDSRADELRERAYRKDTRISRIIFVVQRNNAKIVAKSSAAGRPHLQ